MSEDKALKQAQAKRQPVARQSEDLLARRLEELRRCLPEAFVEGKVDFERLRAALGDVVDDSPERYTFTWAGKRAALRLLQMPTRATLLPCPEESLDWDTTHNVFIEGENLEVLKLLLRPYYGRVKMIYIDPPYNTGNDFIYRDDYRDPLGAYLQMTGQRDEAGNLLTSNPETSGRYHSAWLSMMYPRLFLARQLLREDGVIFVSIDDHEVHNLRIVMNEVFGEENHLATLVWDLGTGTAAGHFTRSHEYIVAYGRAKEVLPNFGYAGPQDVISERATKRWTRANPPSDIKFPQGVEIDGDPDAEFEGKMGLPAEPIEIVSSGAGGRHVVFRNGRLAYPVVLRAGWANRNQILSWLKGQPTQDSKGQTVRRFFFDQRGVLKYEKVRGTVNPATVLRGVASTRNGTNQLEQMMGARVLDFPKPVELLSFLSGLIARDKDIVLDFFAGSCTTAQAVLELNREDGGNRRFMMVQLPEPTPEGSATREAGFETIADIGKERIRRVIARLKEQNEGRLDLPDRETPEDLGFRVYKLAPSNYRSWKGVEAEGDQPPPPEVYIERMEMFTDNLADGWTAEGVIAEVAIKEAGFGLNYRVEAVEALEQTVYRVTDPDREQIFYLCLDDTVYLENLKPLGLDRDTLFVCRASALDDETAANLALQCRLRVI